ncbi:DUF6344 domain-containing protein [Streptomyces rimosus]|uniref:DUF6344 domain-containing protein n=1 Tax=Streptomyces rimosus TaxID=1927 RepID=UPI00067D08B2|nr:DUF6344 domain-containing protein [Streptomyces rimosus]
MAATKVTRLWAAFVVVVVKMLAALGFRTPATATSATTGAVAVPAPAPAPAAVAEAGDGWADPPVDDYAGEPAGAPGGVCEEGGVPWDVPVFALPRMRYGRILPPTMKQRIRAEAHGAAPSSRSVPVELSDAPYTRPVGAPPARPASVPPARPASVPQARRPERDRVLCPA